MLHFLVNYFRKLFHIVVLCDTVYTFVCQNCNLKDLMFICTNFNRHIMTVWETIFFKHSPKWRVDWNKYSPKWNRARQCLASDIFFNSPTNAKYRILRTIGRYLFPSTRWLRPIIHIDLYKDEVKKNLESLKKISIKMTILFTVYLYFAVVFFSE